MTASDVSLSSHHHRRTDAFDCSDGASRPDLHNVSLCNKPLSLLSTSKGMIQLETRLQNAFFLACHPHSQPTDVINRLFLSRSNYRGLAIDRSLIKSTFAIYRAVHTLCRKILPCFYHVSCEGLRGETVTMGAANQPNIFKTLRQI